MQQNTIPYTEDEKIQKFLIQNTLFSLNFFHTLYKFSKYERNQNMKKEKNPMIHAVAYCQIPENKENEFSNRNTNIAFFENYASKNNMNLIYIYMDYQNSEVKNHVAFNQMIQDSEKAAFDVVLIKEKDLFSTEGICADVYIFDRRD